MTQNQAQGEVGVMKLWADRRVKSVWMHVLFVVVIGALVSVACGEDAVRDLMGPNRANEAARATDQVLDELKAQATTAVENAHATDVHELFGMRFLALEATDGWCFPAIGDAETQICGYHLDWRIQLPTRETATNITCQIKTNSLNVEVVTIGANVASINEGSWQGSTEIGGAWPGLGDYTEVIECVVKEYNLASGALGEEIDSGAVSYNASLATLRE